MRAVSEFANIYLCREFVDFRKSINGLSAIVEADLSLDLRASALFIFANKRRTHLKMLWHDGSGYCVVYKRLDRGTYRIPLAIPTGAARVSVGVRELALVLEGIDESALRAARRAVATPR